MDRGRKGGGIMKYIIVLFLFVSTIALAQRGDNPINYGNGLFKSVKIGTINVGPDIQRSLDSIGTHWTYMRKQSDSLSAHLVRLNKAVDSISAHRSALNKSVDSVIVHRAQLNKDADSIKAHLARLNTSVDSISAHRARLNTSVDSIKAHLARMNVQADSLTSHNSRLNANKQLSADSIAAHNSRLNANKQLAADSIAARLAWSKTDRDSIGSLRSVLGREYMGSAYLRSSGDSVSITIPNIKFGVATWSTSNVHIGSLYIVGRPSYFTIFSNGDESIDSLKVNYRVQQ